VQAVDGDSADVLAPPLLWDGARIALGQPTPRRERWRENGRSFVPAPSPGQLVSLHWDFVCDVLTPTAVASLRRATARALAAVESAGATRAVLA
jgi:hypothetical protein